MFTTLKSFISPASSPPPSASPTAAPASVPAPAPAASSDPRPAQPSLLPYDEDLSKLKSQLPLAACGDCDACDDEHESEGGDVRLGGFPGGFEMDWETDMLGDIIKPMNRLALISTSATNWPKEISEEPETLACHLAEVIAARKIKSVAGEKKDRDATTPADVQAALDGLSLREAKAEKIPGIYETKEESKIAVLASSVQVGHEKEDGQTSVLVFPDYKFLSSVPNSQLGASYLYTEALAPSVGRYASPSSDTGTPALASWPLPYKAVVLLCSHKNRDKRCSIAAPLLETALTSSLIMHGYHVDTTGDALHHASESPKDKSQDVEQTLKETADSSREIGMFKISHLSGHKYTGVMIICFPSGAILYYGRVTPRKCGAIVKQTILGGQVMAEHLRGGGNLRRDGKKGLADW